MNIIFQQEADETFRQPWPVVVDDASTVVSGRPDAEYLIGFAAPENPFEVTHFAGEALEKPEVAIGTIPVYSQDGKFFSVTETIRECREYTGDVEALRERHV